MIITQGHPYRFADRFKSGKVYNRVKIIFFKNFFGCGIVQKVNLIELKILAANLFNPVHRLHAAVVKVVEKKAAAKGWSVGDYYEVGSVKGVVVWVDESTEHGRIISLDEKVDIWATGGYNTGAKSEEDGKGNTDKVKDINAELSAFPAFKWCVAHGEGWYFPAIMEVYYFLNAKETVNSTLEAHNGTKISDFYWSSTEGEEDETAALYGYLKSDGTATSYGDFKENPESDTLVRAMYQF